MIEVADALLSDKLVFKFNEIREAVPDGEDALPFIVEETRR